MKTRIKALLGLIEDEEEKLQQACQKDANHAFATVKQNTSLSSLGLNRVIVNALERVKIHNLRDLAPNMYNLVAIPNIGPSRAETIKAAFEESIKVAAHKSCHTLQMVEMTRKHVIFRVSLTATVNLLLSKRDALKRQADDYYADPEMYYESSAYREELNQSKGRIINEAAYFIEEVRTIRKNALTGQLAFAPHRLTEKTCKSSLQMNGGKLPSVSTLSTLGKSKFVVARSAANKKHTGYSADATPSRPYPRTDKTTLAWSRRVSSASGAAFRKSVSELRSFRTSISLPMSTSGATSPWQRCPCTTATHSR